MQAWIYRQAVYQINSERSTGQGLRQKIKKWNTQQGFNYSKKSHLFANTMPVISVCANSRLHPRKFSCKLSPNHLKLKIRRSFALLMMATIQAKHADIKPILPSLCLLWSGLILRASSWSHQDRHRAFKINFTFLTSLAYPLVILRSLFTNISCQGSLKITLLSLNFPKNSSNV